MANLRMLKKTDEFKKVYRRGKAVDCGFVVIYRLAHNQGGKRFGFSVSKKIGKAVQRNRVKRILKEVCRNYGSVFPDNYDYVLVARVHVTKMSLDSVVNRIRKCLGKFRKYEWR